MLDGHVLSYSLVCLLPTMSINKNEVVSTYYNKLSNKFSKSDLKFTSTILVTTYWSPFYFQIWAHGLLHDFSLLLCNKNILPFIKVLSKGFTIQSFHISFHDSSSWRFSLGKDWCVDQNLYTCFLPYRVSSQHNYTMYPQFGEDGYF